MTKSKAKPFSLPDWISSDLLDAWEHYFIQRERHKYIINDRVRRSRLKQLEKFRRYSNVNLVEIVDRSSEGNGKKPYREFYLPPGSVITDYKPVQHRKVIGKTYSYKEVATKLIKDVKDRRGK